MKLLDLRTIYIVIFFTLKDICEAVLWHIQYNGRKIAHYVNTLLIYISAHK